MINENILVEHQALIDQIKSDCKFYWGDLLDDTEITWFCTYNISVCLMEDVLKIPSSKYTAEYFIENKDDFIFWNGIKKICIDIINSAELISDMEIAHKDLEYSHASLDESGIIFYFFKDPFFLVKDKLGYMFSSILSNNLVGEKDGLFACNYDYLKCISLSIKEREIVHREKDVRKTYVMIDDRTGFYKIGYSNNPKFRESTLQSENPKVKLLFYCESFIERELHKKYSYLRVRGEWFNLSDNHIIDIYNVMSKEKGFYDNRK